jgi:hypothetical protein
MAAPVSRTNRCRRRGTCALPLTLGPLMIKQAVALMRTRRGTCALQSGSLLRIGHLGIPSARLLASTRFLLAPFGNLGFHGRQLPSLPANPASQKVCQSARRTNSCSEP